MSINFGGLSSYVMVLNIAAVVTAAVVDFRSRKIPNFTVAIMALCGVVYVAAIDLQNLFYHFLSAVYVSGVVIILFQRKVLGGGDAKMLAALALWFTPQQIPLFFIWTLICGGVLGTLYLAVIAANLARERFLPRFGKLAIDPKAGMPYGVATAAGFAIAAMRVF